MSNFILETHGRLGLLVHGAGTYSRDEWRMLIAMARRRDVSLHLAYEEGGSIDSAQRRELVEAMEGHTPRAAVMTPSRVARGMVTALSWFQSEIKAFAPDQYEDAATHLQLTNEERQVARVALQQALKRIGVRSA